MASEAAAAPAAHVVDECRGVLFVYSDGSVVRRAQPGFATPVRDDGSVEFDEALRLYRPRDRRQDRLPVFFYFHGGGFCIGSRTWPNVQNYCLRLAADLGAPDYHLAVRFSSPAALAPAVAVRGYVQLMPFFGGTERTRSEAECPDDAFLNRPLNDRYWRLSLPEGATADHPVAAPALDAVEFAPTGRVVVGGRDILHDRAVDYAKRLKAAGKPVEVRDFDGQQHGFFTIDPWSDASAELMRVIKRFVDSDGRFD